MEEPLVKRRKYRWILLVLLIVVALIRIFSINRLWVEEYYSTNVYVGIGRFYRILFGWLPISFGDILYGTAVVYLLHFIWKLTKAAYRRKFNKGAAMLGLKKVAIVVGMIYVLFNINWGLNYNRLGIAHQLQLSPKEYTKEELLTVSKLLIERVNASRRAFDGSEKYPTYRQVFVGAQEAYERAKPQYPFLNYKNASIKRSLYGRGGNYFGFLGYYNPFTGESQLNLTMPRFLIPFVTCHEMAHQLGYANESEANFIGYLTATSSGDPFFHYSAYFDMFNYANVALAKSDSIQAKENFKSLDTLVKKDFAELRDFYKKYRNPIEPIIWAFYDKYLKANQQDKGVESYNQVLGFLVAYQKKYGKL